MCHGVHVCTLWKDTGFGNVLPWEDIANQAERLLEMRRAGQDATKEDNDNGEQDYDREVEQDETNPYDEVFFGRRRPDSVVVDWANKVLFVLEFKRTSDQSIAAPAIVINDYNTLQEED